MYKRQDHICHIVSHLYERSRHDGKGKFCKMCIRDRAKWNAYPQLIVLGAAFSIGFTCLSAMAEIAFYSESYQESQAIAYAAGFPAQIVCLGILAPLAEEMMFRGILFKRYRENNRFFRAAVYSALLFGLIDVYKRQL